MEENKNFEKELLEDNLEKEESLQDDNLEENCEEDSEKEEDESFEGNIVEDEASEDNLENSEQENNEDLDSENKKDKEDKKKKSKKKKNKSQILDQEDKNLENLEENSNLEEKLDFEKELDLEENKEHSLLDDIVVLDDITYAEILNSEDEYSVDDLVSTLKKELDDLSKESDTDKINSKYNDLLNKTYNSKYKDCYEAYGLFIYYSYKIDKELNYQNIMDNFDNNVQVLSHIYAVMIANNTKNKQVKKQVLKELSSKNAQKTYLKKFYKLSKNKKILFKYTEASKKKKFKKFYKAVYKFAKKQETIDLVCESLLRYTFKSFEYLKVKKGNKFYNKIESKFTNELRIYALLKLAKGFGKIRKFKKSKELFEKVLTLDSKNFEALEGIFLVKNKCNYLEELAYKKHLAKAKGFNEFIEKANELEEDRAKHKVSNYVEINKKQHEDKIDDILKNIKKHVAVISFSGILIFGSLATFLNGTGLKVLFYISVALFIGSGFITRHIKKSIANIIIKAIIGLGILFGGILFLFKLF